MPKKIFVFDSETPIGNGFPGRWQWWGQVWEAEGKTAVWRQEYLDWGHTAVRGEGCV